MPVIDTKLKLQLEGSGLHFEVSSHYLCGCVEFANGRSQVFYIDPTIDVVGDHEDHDIISPIVDLEHDERGVRNKSYELLRFSGTQRLGHVCVIGSMLVYKADCSSNATPSAFRSVVEAVCRVADKLEKAITGGVDAY
jgi:hypothetical protein